MTDFLRIGEVARELHVTTQTVRRYVKDGRLQADLTPGGRYTFQRAYVDQFLGLEPQETSIVFYVRASDGDKTLLEKQVLLLQEKYGAPQRVYSDKSSGLNEKRVGLSKLLRDAKARKFSRVAVTHKDRLARFGTHYLDMLLQEYNVELVILDESNTKSLHEELMQDFMSLIASFSGKYYRLRGTEQAKKLLTQAQDRLP